MTLSIIIVNYNVKYFLEQCLCSVKKAISSAGPVDTEVFVVDNNSPDNSVAYLQPLFPWVHFIQNKENSGYASANNQGWKMASGKYILFLNPDTILAEDSLQQTVSFLEKTKGVGAAGIRMIDGSGNFLPESKRGFPSPLVSFYKLSGLTALFPRSKRLAYYYLGHLSEKENHEVDVLSGAYLMTTKEILEKINGFDEQFFMYAEDIDLSYRIEKAGYKNFYLGSGTILHFKGESTRKDIKYVKIFYAAMSLFVKKHYPGPSSFLLRILLQSAIVFRGTVAWLSQLLFSSPVPNSSLLKTLVLVSTESEKKEVQDILGKYPVFEKNTIHVLPANDLLKSRTDKDIDEIIFVAGKQNYNDILREIQHLSHQIVFRFHAAGSKSIVSSFSKKSSGEVFTKE